MTLKEATATFFEYLSPALLPAAIEELLRRHPIVTVGRLVRRDVEIGSALLKEGEVVILPTPLHGMDERDIPQALSVDFHRVRVIHSTSGNGPHRCPGSHLARTEISITLEEWLARIPDFRLAPGAEVHFKGGVVGAVEGLPLVW